MSEAVPSLRWWGWGDRVTPIPPGLAVLLAEELGIEPGEAPGPPPLDALRIPATRLPASLVAALRTICGEGGVDLSHEARVRHAAGRSYLDLLRLRSGTLDDAPDAVVRPSHVDQVGAVLRACAGADCAVVPVGGGTSVVGGIAPLRGDKPNLVALSLRRLNALRAVDPVAGMATLEAGMTGPEAEAALAEHGLTLGHFPQSFEYATIGGFAATRSSGQESGGYGRFEDMVLGLRCATPIGELVTGSHPATAAGPSLREVLLGSEGRFGVITEVTVRVHRRSAGAAYLGWSFPSLTDGLRALQATAQAGVAPDLARLSDVEETRIGLAMADRGRTVDRAGRLYLRARGRGRGCLLITGWRGEGVALTGRRLQAHGLIRRYGGMPLGAGPGRAWEHGRFEGPYLRDRLIDAGVLVETLETATTWTRLRALHGALTAVLRAALGDGGVAPLVGSHVSHVYPTGASLYVTVLARAGADPAARWRAAKDRATATILENGGTLTHHHAVGTDHRPYLEREIGPAGVEALRSLARTLDPAAILNPDKLIPE